MTTMSRSTLTLLGTGTSMGVPMIGCDCEVCRSSNPRNQRTRTGVLVETPEGNFLIDTSPELRLQLVRERVQMIEAVLFTHAHADHILGLDDLRIFGFKRKGPVPLYCEQPVEQTLRRQFFYAFDEQEKMSAHSTPQLEFHRLTFEPLSVCGLQVRPFRVWHGETPVMAFRINNVAFVTDCKAIPPESWPLLEGLDTLVIDALWDEPHPTHMNVAEALETIEKVRPRRAYFTHVSHRLEYEATNARLPDGVELSYDGLRIEL
jgi:phosphoribosyl 1,2-cyclic phosphate phosphodiesterase